MNEFFNKQQEDAVVHGSAVTAGLNTFMLKVFGLMFLGVLLTAGSAFAFIAALLQSAALRALTGNLAFSIGIIVVTLGLVFVLSAAINKLSAGVARLMFLLYAALNGVMFSFTFLFYIGIGQTHIIALAFMMAAVFFGTMVVFGLTTKADLTSAGRIFMAGLVAIIIAMVINFFLQSSALEYAITIGGIAVFTGLTAYDTKKLKDFYLNEAGTAGLEAASKVAILGALKLYLDFINLFLFILRFLGNRD